jgi:branched-chain amino acid transport system ATP-binding protein
VLLEVRNVDVFYGGLQALARVSISISAGEFVTIIGPNGAGKTTLFKAISGTVQPTTGQILWDGRDILSVAPAMRARLGISHVPEGRQVFKSLTVQDNLELGALTARDSKEDVRERFEWVLGLLPRLRERREQLAGTLSGGEQQMLAIARGLVSAPRLLMLDEPSMGLSPAMADTIFECIEQVHAEMGMTVLLVEQRAAEALSACDRGYLLDTGHVVLEGGQRELLQDDRVQKAYLGL